MAASATVLGGFWPQNGVSTLTLVQDTGPGRRRAAQALGKKSLRALRELMLTLDGATAGSTAAETNGRVAHSTELGGVRTIESEELVNRATVAGDVTIVNADILELSGNTYTASPIANGDGNPLGVVH